MKSDNSVAQIELKATEVKKNQWQTYNSKGQMAPQWILTFLASKDPGDGFYCIFYGAICLFYQI